MAFMMMAIGSTVVAYWKCPDDDTEYKSKKSALNNCEDPDKCRQECHNEFVEDPGLFGHGGIAGIGIGKHRGYPSRVCNEVCDSGKKSSRTQEKPKKKSDVKSRKSEMKSYKKVEKREDIDEDEDME